MMRHLGVPLGTNVLERGGVDGGVEHEEDIRLWVRQGTQAIVIILTCCVPKSKVVWFAIEHHVGTVVVENRGKVIFREGVLSVADQHGSLSNCAITEMQIDKSGKVRMRSRGDGRGERRRRKAWQKSEAKDEPDDHTLDGGEHDAKLL